MMWHDFKRDYDREEISVHFFCRFSLLHIKNEPIFALAVRIPGMK
jgi:hypothetical protein